MPENSKVSFEQMPYFETLERMTDKQLAVAIVHYIFRDGPIESMHSTPSIGLSEEHMKTLNKYAMERAGEIIALFRAGEWMSLFGVLGASANSSAVEKWDDPQPDLKRLTGEEFIHNRFAWMNLSNPDLLDLLKEQISKRRVCTQEECDEEALASSVDGALPDRDDVVGAVSAYAIYLHDLFTCAELQEGLAGDGEAYRSVGATAKGTLSDQVYDALEVAGINLLSLAKMALSDLMICLKRTQKLPVEEQVGIFGFDISSCDLDDLADLESSELDIVLNNIMCFEDIDSEELFENFCWHLREFYGLDEEA